MTSTETQDGRTAEELLDMFDVTADTPTFCVQLEVHPGVTITIRKENFYENPSFIEKVLLAFGK